MKYVPLLALLLLGGLACLLSGCDKDCDVDSAEVISVIFDSGPFSKAEVTRGLPDGCLYEGSGLLSPITGDTCISGNLDDVGNMSVGFVITALDKDLFIPPLASSAPSLIAHTGIVEFTDEEVIAGVSVYARIISTDPDVLTLTKGGNYRVPKGEKMQFALYFKVRNRESQREGYYRGRITRILYSTEDGSDYEVMSTGLEEFRSPYVWVN